MSRGELSTTGVLNAVAPRLRGIAAPAVGILMLTSLPYRLLQIQFLDILIRLTTDALHYGNLLTAVAAAMVVAYIISLYGRAVFMRALHQNLEGWRDLLRVRPRTFLAYVYVGLLIEMTFVMLWYTVVGAFLAAIFAAIAAVVTIEDRRPGVLLSLRALSPYLTHGKVLVGLTFVFTIGLLVTWVNMHYLAQIVLWAAQAIPGFDAVKWMMAMEGGFSRYRLVMVAFAIAMVEPFWLTAIYIFGERVRSRQSGDDLLRRFRSLMAEEEGEKKLIRASVVALTFGLAAFGSAALADATIPLNDYIRELETIRVDLAERRDADAATRAKSLEGFTWVTWDGGRFQPDRALLEAVADSQKAAATQRRLAVTLDALSAREPAGEVKPANAALLEQIRASEKAEELWKGGELGEVHGASPGVVAYLGDMFRRAIDWLAEKLEWLYDLLAKLFRRKRGVEERELLGVPTIVWLVTLLVLAVVLLLAINVLRRSRKKVAPVASEEVLSSARDADPLSRESDEWERYAQELAASGRIREAIRAWYHAVLVTLYGRGILHYRKGRTNWEYVRALPATADWRPQFIAITRLFEVEWYGHREGDRETLDACMRDARAILQAVTA